jgi:hypothetical protein
VVVIMAVAVIVTVTVTVTVTVRVDVRVRQVRVTVTIGAGFGFEGLGRKRHLKAELTNHVVQDVIVQVGQTQRADLDRDVAIAQVVGSTRQFQRIARGHDRKALQGRLHPHDQAVVRAQAIAVLKIRASLEQERGFTAVIETQQAARLLARRVIERDRDRRGHGGGDFF